MENLLFNLYEDKNAGKTEIVASKSSCRGWSKIDFHQVVSMSSCRGWCKINFYTAK